MTYEALMWSVLSYAAPVRFPTVCTESIIYSKSGAPLVSQVVSASDSHTDSPKFDTRGCQNKFAEQRLLTCGIAAHAESGCLLP